MSEYDQLYLKCIAHDSIPFVPFLKRRRKTAFYYLNKERYGQFFQDDIDDTGRYIEESEFDQKTSLQRLYQKQCEENGAVLRAIWLATYADDNSSARDYLAWLSASWSAYLEDQLKPDSGTLTFIEFMQSNIGRSENDEGQG